MGNAQTILDYSAYYRTSDTYSSNLVTSVPTRDLYRAFRNQGCCPYCQEAVESVMKGFLPGPEWDPLESRTVQIWGCTKCGWWHDEFSLEDPTMPRGWERIKRRVPYLRRFSIDSTELPLRALSIELARNPGALHNMHPGKFEQFVAAVLSHVRDVNVRVLGRTGDGGIDLVYIDGDEPFAVQVKRRASPGAKEGVRLVREFLGACVLGGYRKARIVTTAQAFTRGASATAGSAIDAGHLDSFDLIDRDQFLSLFRFSSLCYKYPWTEVARGWKRAWSEYEDAEFIGDERLIT